MKVIVITFLLAMCLETVLTCRFGREYMDFLRQQALQRRFSENYDEDDSPYPMNLDSAKSPLGRSQSQNRYNNVDGNGKSSSDGIGGNGGGVGGGAIAGPSGGSENTGGAAVIGSGSGGNGVDGNNTGDRRSDSDNLNNGINGVQDG